jgi:hypothetical protein
MLNFLKNIVKVLVQKSKETFVYRAINKLFQNTFLGGLTILCTVLVVNQGHMYYDDFMVMYHDLNDEKAADEADDPNDHLEFKLIGDNLYTLTGSVGDGDCERIIPDMPQAFTVILESPGGNLAEGSCLAAHLKLRDVVTVVRDTTVMNENGEIIYTPGTIPEDDNYMAGKTMCASACSLMFLGGDQRYLIGDVWLGIHGPGTPEGAINNLNRRQLESSSFRTAANLMQLLQSLGVESPDLRLLFIKIPNSSMYWLKPNDFPLRKGLIELATNYRNFWGFSGSAPDAGLK